MLSFLYREHNLDFNLLKVMWILEGHTKKKDTGDNVPTWLR